MTMICFDTETTGIGPDARITCAATCDENGIAKVWHSGGGCLLSADTGNELAKYLLNAKTVVTFNGAAFDLRLLYELTHNCDLKGLALNHCDIMYDWVSQKRYYASMQSFAEPTLGEGKSNTGLWAVTAWFEGQHTDVLEYCKRDVEILRELMLAIERDKQLLRKSKNNRVSRWRIAAVRSVADAANDVAPVPAWMTSAPPDLPDTAWTKTPAAP